MKVYRIRDKQTGAFVGPSGYGTRQDHIWTKRGTAQRHTTIWNKRVDEDRYEVCEFDLEPKVEIQTVRVIKEVIVERNGGVDLSSLWTLESVITELNNISYNLPGCPDCEGTLAGCRNCSVVQSSLDWSIGAIEDFVKQHK